MRKVDYQLLAVVIAKTRSEARRAIEHGSEKIALAGAVRERAAEDIARDFARSAHVDKTAFLKACDIDP